MKRLILIALVLGLSINVLAQYDNLLFRRMYSGIPKSTIYSIDQDSTGYLWFGSETGLFRYDGYTCKHFYENLNDPNSLPSSAIHDIAVDGKGRVWVATPKGFAVYDDKTEWFKSYDKEVLPNMKENYCNRLLTHPDGTIWIGTIDGIGRFDPEKEEYSNIDIIDSSYYTFSNGARSMILDKDNNIWIGSGGEGLYKLNAEGKLLRKFYQTNEKYYRMSHPFSLHEDEEGTIWTGLFIGGLMKYDTEVDSFVHKYNHHYTPGNFMSGCISINSLDNDHLLVGLNGGGLAVFNKKTEEFTTVYMADPNDSRTIGDNFISVIFKDNGGRTWIGTENGGVCLLDPFYQKFHAFPHSRFAGSRSVETTNTILEDREGNVWLGTETGYIETYDKDRRFINSFQVDNKRFPGQGVFVKGLVEDSEGRILALTNMGGTIIFNGVGDTVGHYPITDNIKLLHRDFETAIAAEDGTIWLGSYNDLIRYDNQAYTDTYAQDLEGTVSQRINSLTTSGNKIYIGYRFLGFAVFDMTERKIVEEYKRENSDIIDDHITFVHYDDGYVWIGTNVGLQRFNIDTKEFESFFMEDGLSNNVIYSICSSENDIWMSTSHGITRYSKSTGRFRAYHYSDGLVGDQFRHRAMHVSRSGELFFGSSDGIANFKSIGIQADSTVGQLVFTDFKLEDNHVVPGEESLIKDVINRTDEIVLNYDHPLISFEFSLMNYSFPEKNIYMYKLEGLDTSWHMLGNRRYVSFNRLPPNEYTLLVKAANHDGVWMDEPRAIRIVVLPPFWQTAWFRVLVVAIIVLIIIMVFRWRVSSIKQRKEELEEEVELRTAEIKEQKDEIEHQKDEILQSIQYARRLQEAILPPEEMMASELKKGFVYYRPKDIVAGDFYWFEKKENLLFIAVADCTGHGVPGAMVSVVCSTALNRCVKEFGLLEAGEILDKTAELVEETFEKSHYDVQDGMDISLLVLNKATNEITWAGAHNPLWILPAGQKEIEEIKADKQPVAKFLHATSFTNHRRQLNAGDRFYLFTDGYPDQFGGEKGKKFKYKPFRRLLESYASTPMADQEKLLEDFLVEWMGKLEQIDDVCIMGIEV